MIELAAAAVVAALTFGIGSASDATAENTTSSTVEDGDRIICKRVKITGTHTRTRMCKPKSVWMAEDRPKIPDPRPSEYRDPTTPR